MFDYDFDESSPTIYPYTVYNFNGVNNNSTLEPWNKQSGGLLKREVNQRKKDTLFDYRPPQQFKDKVSNMKRTETMELSRKKFRINAEESQHKKRCRANIPISNLTFTAGLNYEQKSKSLYENKKNKKLIKSNLKGISKNFYTIPFGEKTLSEEIIGYKIWKPSIDKPFQLKKKKQQQQRTQQILMRRQINFSKTSILDILSEKHPSKQKKNQTKIEPTDFRFQVKKSQKFMHGVQKIRREKEFQKRKARKFDNNALGF